MGSQPAPVHQNTKAAARSRAPDLPRETERLDPTDTRVMATRHLAPYVSEEEVGEYQRFISVSVPGTHTHTHTYLTRPPVLFSFFFGINLYTSN